jgi:hypothetical protein
VLEGLLRFDMNGSSRLLRYIRDILDDDFYSTGFEKRRREKGDDTSGG